MMLSEIIRGRGVQRKWELGGHKDSESRDTRGHLHNSAHSMLEI